MFFISQYTFLRGKDNNFVFKLEFLCLKFCKWQYLMRWILMWNLLMKNYSQANTCLQKLCAILVNLCSLLPINKHVGVLYTKAKWHCIDQLQIQKYNNIAQQSSCFFNNDVIICSKLHTTWLSNELLSRSFKI